MLYLEDNVLNFSFPEVHEQARLKIKLLRTLRVPDDGNGYPLPVRLGTFPVRHVDDAGDRVPEVWLNRGGVMVPMYQAEAMILEFDTDWVEGRGCYPFAVKVGTGKINAVTGRAWTAEINERLQDYIVPPRQQWLDGYNVDRETVRQFVAMPLGKGLTAEEQITGCHTWGGIQLQAYPMKREAFDKHFPPPKPKKERALPAEPLGDSGTPMFSIAGPTEYILGNGKCHPMGIAPGGKVEQFIYPDTYGSDVWDKTMTSRGFVHLCNSAQWKAITGEKPPAKMITKYQYQDASIPWCKAYKEKAHKLKGSATLASIDSVGEHS